MTAQNLKRPFKLWRNDKVNEKAPTSKAWQAILVATVENIKAALQETKLACAEAAGKVSPQAELDFALTAAQARDKVTLRCAAFSDVLVPPSPSACRTDDGRVPMSPWQCKPATRAASLHARGAASRNVPAGRRPHRDSTRLRVRLLGPWPIVVWTGPRGLQCLHVCRWLQKVVGQINEDHRKTTRARATLLAHPMAAPTIHTASDAVRKHLDKFKVSPGTHVASCRESLLLEVRPIAGSASRRRMCLPLPKRGPRCVRVPLTASTRLATLPSTCTSRALAVP